MAGPTQPWDQPEDPREQTVDLPRIEPTSNGNGHVTNGGRAGNSREFDGPPPSRNGHSPATNGTPRWPVIPDPPLRRLPDVNGDPYAQPGQPSRPSSLFEPPARSRSTPPPRSEPSMPPVPPASPPLMPPLPALPPRAEPSMPPVPPADPLSTPASEQPIPASFATQAAPMSAPGSTRSPESAQPDVPESADRSEEPSDPASPPPRAGAINADNVTADGAGSGRVGAAVGAILRADSDGQGPAGDSRTEAVPAASTAEPTREQRPESGPPPTAVRYSQAARGSIADLKSRLDRLPDGHPSSPYDDGGSAKPMPHRLKQLELGLPAPERDTVEASPRFTDLIGNAADNRQPSRNEQANRTRESKNLDGELPSQEPEPSQGGDLSQNPAMESRPSPPTTSATATNGDDNEHAWSGNMPATPAAPPDTTSAGKGAENRRFDPSSAWQDPYALPNPTRNGSHPPSLPPDGELHPGSDRDRAGHEPADHDQHDRRNHDRATRERRGATDSGIAPHRDLRPATGSPVVPPDSRDPAHPRNRDDRSRPDQHDRGGPYQRGRGGPYRRGGPEQSPPGGRRAHNSQLGAEARELVADLLADARAAEGRTSRGGYGASGLTPVIRRIADQLSGGGLAPGSESTSLKSAERLSAKLARLIARHPDRTASELAVSICDVVRYAFAFEPGLYAEGTWLVHRKLKAQGFELEARRNRWENPEFKGILTRWRDPASDLSFEIQFHTFASWEIFVTTHEAYRSITDPATPSGERARLRARQVTAAARATTPPGCAEIVDFGKGVR
jgi:hypothetical protein